MHHSQDTYGQYKFGYSSSDGQSKTESRTSDGGVSGSFSYTSPEGKPIQLSYVADKDGFRAAGDHLPEAPETPDVPEYLAEAYRDAHDRLAQAYAEAGSRRVSYDDGAYRYGAAYSVYKAPTVFKTYSSVDHDDGSYEKYARLYDDGSYRPSDHQRYTAGYDDGSYKPSGDDGAYKASDDGSYRRYQSVAVVTPAATTRVAVAPQSFAVYPSGAYYAAPAAGAVRTGFGAVSYSTEIGGTPVKVPHAAGYVSSLPAVPAGHKKSAYAYTG